MKLINTTNSNPTLVNEQLAHTDANLVELYSLGSTDVIYTDANTHSNLVIINKKRKLKRDEIDFVVKKLFKVDAQDEKLEYINCSYFTEISLEK